MFFQNNIDCYRVFRSCSRPYIGRDLRVKVLNFCMVFPECYSIKTLPAYCGEVFHRSHYFEDVLPLLCYGLCPQDRDKVYTHDLDPL